MNSIHSMLFELVLPLVAFLVLELCHRELIRTLLLVLLRVPTLLC